MANCKSCNASIIWVKTPLGKRMPVDAAPVPDGAIALTKNLASFVPADRREEFLAARIPLFKSHFATCPAAKKHRKLKHQEADSDGQETQE